MPAEQLNKGTVYDSPNQDPGWAEKWQGPNIKKYKDAVFDKISELLLKQWSQIEPHIDGNSFESLQKTYKDGNLISGRKTSDMMVVYESDVDANRKDGKTDDALLGWLNFIDVNQIKLSFQC